MAMRIYTEREFFVALGQNDFERIDDPSQIATAWRHKKTGRIFVLSRGQPQYPDYILDDFLRHAAGVAVEDDQHSLLYRVTPIR